MKRILAIAAVALAALLCASEINAQKFGITGGATFTSMQNIEASSKTGFNIGATAQLRLPLGFSVQPSFIYNQKSAEVGGDLVSTSMDIGYLELPVSVQWGPDLLLFRPFLDVTPFVGYAVNSTIKTEALNALEVVTKNDWDGFRMNRFSYGLGLGGGIEVWRLQFICRYNWNFGVLGSLKDFTNIQLDDLKSENEKFGGISVHLAFFF